MIHQTIVEKFRGAKSVAEIEKVTEDHAADLEKLRTATGEYAGFIYNSTRESYKYYRKLLRESGK